MKFNYPVKHKLICQVTGKHYISLRKNFTHELNNQLDYRVITQCENQLYTQLYNQLDIQLRIQLEDQLAIQLAIQLDHEILKSNQK